MYIEEEKRLTDRATAIADWLVYLESLYSGLLSRESEQASLSGFDPAPNTKPCEHRIEWMRGGLCLGCENTGWRPLTRGERAADGGIDPYAADLKRGVVVVESASSRQARARARLDSALAILERNERVRSGGEALESRELRQLRIAGSKPLTLQLILQTIERLREDHRALYESLSHSQLCLLLARLVPGRIYPAPL